MPRLLVFCFLTIGVAHAQFGRGSGWSTGGADAQRSSWIRSDSKISLEHLQKPGFQFLWKVKLNNQTMQMNSLTGALTLEGYIGYRGFRTLAHLGGSSNKVFAIDTDLGRLEWEKQLPVTGSPAPGSASCPGGMTAELARPVFAPIPPVPVGRGGGGFRGGAAARGGVGEPGEGAVTIAQMAAAQNRGGGPTFPIFFGRGPATPRGGVPRILPNAVYALSSDGKLHSLLVSNGEPTGPAMDFLPPNAGGHGLIIVDGTAYAVTSEGCPGGSGLYAVDLFEKKAASWKPSSGAIAGSLGPAFGPDGSLYVATTAGDLVHLDAKTLAVKDTWSAGKPGLATSPVIFEFKDKPLVAVLSADGSISLLADGKQVAKSGASPKSGDVAGAALATWQDPEGTRWILAPTPGAIAAWKVVDQNGTPALQSGWTSPELKSPATPMVINGVVFALSRGDSRSPAVLYALDSATGKELWNSGKAIGSFVHSGALSGGGNQVYLETNDGTLYAFGYYIEH